MNRTRRRSRVTIFSRCLAWATVALLPAAMTGLPAAMASPPVAAARAPSAPVATAHAAARCTVPGTVEGRTPSMFPSGRGTLRVVMIFVDFSNAPSGIERPKAIFDAMAKPAEKWYADSSYGKLDVRIKPVLQWLQMPKTVEQYGLNSESITADQQIAYMKDAVAIANPYFDFSKVDDVDVVPSSTADVANSEALVVGPAAARIEADGHTMGFGATFGNNIRTGPVGSAGYLTDAPRDLEHETGHTLGLPDLYRYAGGANYFKDVDWWDPMGDLFRGTGFMAWQRQKLGWFGRHQVVCLSGQGSVTESLSTLDRRGGVKMIAVQLNKNKVLTVEARRPNGSDFGLCDSGVLVSVVDGRTANGDGPIRVQPATRGSPDDACGSLANAAYNVGPGQVSTYRDLRHGLTVKVLQATATGWRVRVTRRAPGAH